MTTDDELVAPGHTVQRDGDGKFTTSKLSSERARELSALSHSAAIRRKGAPERERAISETLIAAIAPEEDSSERGEALRVLLTELAGLATRDNNKSLEAVLRALELVRAFPGRQEAPVVAPQIVLDPAAAAFIDSLWTEDPEEREFLERFGERWDVQVKHRQPVR